jgi:hypothetical protein
VIYGLNKSKSNQQGEETRTRQLSRNTCSQSHSVVSLKEDSKPVVSDISGMTIFCPEIKLL